MRLMACKLEKNYWMGEVDREKKQQWKMVKNAGMLEDQKFGYEKRVVGDISDLEN